MANTCLLSLSFCFLVLFGACCSAQIAQVTSTPSWFGQQQQQQQHRLKFKRNECQLENLNALEPTRRVRSEAGVTEFWDENDQQFNCAGVSAVRHVIEPKGLLLPSFTNSPHLTYIVQGKGVLGVIFPGCAETFQSGRSSQSQSYKKERSQGKQRYSGSEDQHQKVRNFREGDVLAFPAGVAHWVYNDGSRPIVAVTVYDTSNAVNQLDQNLRKFFLAGSGHQESRQGEHKEQKGRRGQQGEEEGGNLFSGFDEQLLADAFNVDTELIRNLQSQDDRRGSIIKVRDELQFLSPESQEEEQQSRRRGGSESDNGLEETFCTMRLSQNINDAIQADVYNPRGGRVTSLNSQKLPILSYLQLSAERGVLYRNAILAPQWNINAHSVVYITKGSTRMQIVNDNGQTVFNDQVQEGQLIIVPQNFAVVKRADHQGCEYISFKTNDNAMVSPLAGRTSALRGMPVEVLMNSYNINREQAKNLKFNRDELTVFGPGSKSTRMD